MGANFMFAIGALIVMLTCFLAGFGLCAKLTNDAQKGDSRRNFIHKLFGWCPHCMMWFQDDVRERGYGLMCRGCTEFNDMLEAEREAEYNRSRGCGFF